LLASGGTLRLSSGTALKIVSDHHVRLIDGIVYLDFPPTLVQGERFVVETLAGMFEHSGTQFEIAVQQDRSRLRVREGLVKWRSAGASEITKAGAEMTVERNGVITRQAIVTTGRDWAWAEALAPDYSIDDQPMLGFLEWVARETGRKLTFADSSARNQVTGITLHGSVQGMTIMEALSLVMQTTPLRFDLAEDQIRVSSKGETGATSK
jgi:ferric-dicitrate binding protein FerR (iron transport regulator)